MLISFLKFIWNLLFKVDRKKESDVMIEDAKKMSTPVKIERLKRYVKKGKTE